MLARLFLLGTTVPPTTTEPVTTTPPPSTVPSTSSLPEYWEAATAVSDSLPVIVVLLFGLLLLSVAAFTLAVLR